MNRLELINSIQSLTDENKIVFTIGDEKISNRFDEKESKQDKKKDYSVDISYALYSNIANAIFFKAQGKERASKGYDMYDIQWENIIRGSEKKITENAKAIKDNALRILDSFLYSKSSITMTDLLAKIAPLCVLKVMQDHPKEEKKVMKAFKKKKEVIFNQVLLFSRCLYHTFLNRSDLDSIKIHPDFENLANGIFSYDNKELFIPAWQNAFTLENYKQVVKNGLLRFSQNFPVSEIECISVIYLVKDFIATLPLS